MHRKPVLYVHEHDWLVVGHLYNDVEFTSTHKDMLALYLTKNPGCGYYTVYYDRVRFCEYVGVVGLQDITIEVLPKADRYPNDTRIWQKMLVEMLAISMAVKARATTYAHISVRNYNVLETYIGLFLEEVEKLMHEGLVKRYRTEVGNKSKLNGRLLIHQHISRNMVHAERFFVSHQVYDRDNIFNSLIGEALQAISTMSVSPGINSFCRRLLSDFPECRSIDVRAAHFDRLVYDRKTERYRQAIELARIILLNFHPDLKGGTEHILAIMFDMNLLWETYIFATLLKAAQSLPGGLEIWPQSSEKFWLHPAGWVVSQKPDIVIKRRGDATNVVVVDTKWKYRSKPSTEDLRQLYTYGHYYNARRRYLLYPGNTPQIQVEEGKFYDIDQNQFSATETCGLLFVNPFTPGMDLNYAIGRDILEALGLQ